MKRKRKRKKERDWTFEEIEREEIKWKAVEQEDLGE